MVAYLARYRPAARYLRFRGSFLNRSKSSFIISLSQPIIHCYVPISISYIKGTINSTSFISARRDRPFREFKESKCGLTSLYLMGGHSFDRTVLLFKSQGHPSNALFSRSRRNNQSAFNRPL
jgi:hypothetical protein